MRRSRPVVLTAIALAASAVPAAAAPAWTAPRGLSPDAGDAVTASGAVDAAGAATVVWQQFSAVDQPRIMASTRPPGGDWSVARPISAAGAAVGELPAPSAFDPRVAVSASGTAVAVWRFRDGGGYVMEAAVRPPGGEWGAPQVISRAARRFDAPAVAVDADGDAVAAWVRDGQTGMTVEAVTRPRGGGWSAPVTVSAPGATEAALPAVSAWDGGVVAAWSWRGGPGDLWRVQAAALDGSGWTAPRDVSQTAPSPPVPAAAALAGGAGWVAWDRDTGTGKVAEAVARRADGTWAKPDTLTDRDATAGAPALAVMGDGRVALAAAVGVGPATARVEVRFAAAAGWSGPETLGLATELAVGPRLAAVPGGLQVAWDGCPDGGSCRVRAARRDAAGAWTPSDPPEPGMSLGSLSADASGDVLAVGTRFTGGEPSAVAQVTSLDVAGPELASASVPAAAVAGGAVNMSAAPVDTWSALAGGSRWDFGDGTPQAEGQGVVHTWAAPGAYTVTVTQSDVLGNTSVVRRPVLVTAPPELAFDVPVVVTRVAALRVGAVRAVCLGDVSAAGCRVAVSFSLGTARRVRVRVALRGRSGAWAVTVRGRRGVNRVRLPARIGGIPLRPGVRLAVTVRRV
ncbi:MAG: PKD domain-containing protein [Thermoleophilia bacterium]|nr:PKD domain-containing protein [Thermoleophilia bacterium]